MTCIVGLVDGNDVYVGGDSAGVAGYSICIRADEKVFTNGPFIMGFTTSFRMGSILRYKFEPEPQGAMSDIEYMNTTFIDSIKNCFKANEYGSADKGGSFLVGYKNKLYSIFSDYQVGISANNYDAVGCGMDIALGALYATKGMPALKRVELALKSAAEFSAGVSGPFVIHKLTHRKQKINADVYYIKEIRK